MSKIILMQPGGKKGIAIEIGSAGAFNEMVRGEKIKGLPPHSERLIGLKGRALFSALVKDRTPGAIAGVKRVPDVAALFDDRAAMASPAPVSVQPAPPPPLPVRATPPAQKAETVIPAPTVRKLAPPPKPKRDVSPERGPLLVPALDEPFKVSEVRVKKFVRKTPDAPLDMAFHAEAALEQLQALSSSPVHAAPAAPATIEHIDNGWGDDQPAPQSATRSRPGSNPALNVKRNP